MYLFNIFNESKDNDRIIIILTWSDTNPWVFFWTTLITKNSKIVKLSLISLNIFYKSKWNCIFMIRKDWIFCDQSLKLTTFIWIFFNFNFSFFFQNSFYRNIPLDRSFLMILNLTNSFKCSKYKNRFKKSYFSLIISSCFLNSNTCKQSTRHL